MKLLQFLSLAAILAAIPIAVSGQITVPHTFTAGTTISSSQVNANFAKFADSLNRTGGTMTGTLTTQAIAPDGDNTRDVGSAALSYNDGWFDGTLTTVNNAITGTAGSGFVVTNTAPTLDFTESDAAADNKKWRFQVQGTNFLLQTMDDAYTTASNVLGVSRAGVTSLFTLILTGGQIAFPASQSASAGANTLDDYEEGTWTPVLTFDTAGDLNVVYSTQAGSYTKVGRKVTVDFAIVTSTFTHTTAAGAMKITGLPASMPVNASRHGIGSWYFTGVTIASYTNFTPRAIAGSTQLDVMASGTAQSAIQLTSAHLPTAVQKTFVGSVTYYVD